MQYLLAPKMQNQARNIIRSKLLRLILTQNQAICDCFYVTFNYYVMVLSLEVIFDGLACCFGNPGMNSWDWREYEYICLRLNRFLGKLNNIGKILMDFDTWHMLPN